MQVPEVLKRLPRPILRRTLYAQSVYRPVKADRPFYIRLDITNTCNQACIKCWYPDYAKQGHPVQQMAVADFERLAERLFPYAHFLQIPFAFEALTHPQFARLARIADSYDIPDMGVVTNGTLLCGDKAEALIESRNFMAVNVSLDGVEEARMRTTAGGRNLGCCCATSMHFSGASGNWARSSRI